MASTRKIGFFWGEEKITVIEFVKNAPLQVVSASLDSKNSALPFSSNLTEEIQVSSALQKMLQNNRITVGSFCVSVPMKEIILRSFIIPFVKQEDVQNAIKFEAKKYLPIDVQFLTYVFYTIPFTENKIKRLQVIFFAVRKETLERYERIFKQVNAAISYCEPCVVSLAKVLLFKKEINATDHLAFLSLEKNFGRICFIDHGIPQYVREFSVSSPAPSEEVKDSVESLNLRIVNEVGNSLDFYARQFSGYRIEQILVSGDAVSQVLFDALEAELKLKVRKVSPVITMGAVGQGNDMDTINAMGACIEPPIESLSGFNFIKDPNRKTELSIDSILKSYKESIMVFLLCAVVLIGIYVFCQIQLKNTQQQYTRLSPQGVDLNEPMDSIEGALQQNNDQLAAYKSIRTKSDVVLILLKVASHLPQGVMLTELSLNYDDNDPKNEHVDIDMTGNVYKEDPNDEIGIVNQIYSDFKNDKELSNFIKNVNPPSLNRTLIKGRRLTEFTIRCS